MTRSTGTDHRRRAWLVVAILTFTAWTIGLAVLAFATAEKPRAAAPTAARPG